MEGRALRLLRAIHDVNQAALAENIGCSLSMLAKIEAGTSRVSNDMRQRIAHYFKITPGNFLLFAEALSDKDTLVKKIVGG